MHLIDSDQIVSEILWNNKDNRGVFNKQQQLGWQICSLWDGFLGLVWIHKRAGFRTSQFHTSWKNVTKCQNPIPSWKPDPRISDRVRMRHIQDRCREGNGERGEWKAGMKKPGMNREDGKPQSCWCAVGAGLEPSLMNMPWGKWVSVSKGQKKA